MITLRTFLCFALLTLLTGPIFAADAPERESLEKIIPYGIGLLEAKNYKGFLEAFMSPAELKSSTEGTTLEAVAAEFSKEDAAFVLKVLKALKDLKPKLDEKSTTATYTVPGEGIDGQKEFKFLLIGKYWYIE